MNDSDFSPSTAESSSMASTPTCSPRPTLRSSSPLPSPSRSYLLQPPRLQYTGDWETDARAAADAIAAANQRPPHAPQPSYPIQPELSIVAMPDKPVVDVPPTRRHHLTYRKQRPIRSQSHPYVRPRPSSPGVKPPSTPPPAKRGKPVGEGKMACLFCRGRKIACQPPELENEDKTCK